MAMISSATATAPYVFGHFGLDLTIYNGSTPACRDRQQPTKSGLKARHETSELPNVQVKGHGNRVPVSEGNGLNRLLGLATDSCRIRKTARSQVLRFAFTRAISKRQD